MLIVLEYVISVTAKRVLFHQGKAFWIIGPYLGFCSMILHLLFGFICITALLFSERLVLLFLWQMLNKWINKKSLSLSLTLSVSVSSVLHCSVMCWNILYKYIVVCISVSLYIVFYCIFWYILSVKMLVCPVLLDDVLLLYILLLLYYCKKKKIQKMYAICGSIVLLSWFTAFAFIYLFLFLLFFSLVFHSWFVAFYFASVLYSCFVLFCFVLFWFDLIIPLVYCVYLKSLCMKSL